jgi:hypothetical protein
MHYGDRRRHRRGREVLLATMRVMLMVIWCRLRQRGQVDATVSVMEIGNDDACSGPLGEA